MIITSKPTKLTIKDDISKHLSKSLRMMKAIRAVNNGDVPIIMLITTRGRYLRTNTNI